MYRAILGLAAGVCLLTVGRAPLLATPVVDLDRSTICRLDRSDFCRFDGILTGPAGAALAASLADISVIELLTGEQRLPADAEPSVDLEETFSVLVVSPTMFSSVQLSFDPRLDTGAAAFRSREIGPEAAGIPGKSDAGTVRFDTRQVELTLGAVTSSIKGEKVVGARAFGKNDYMNFSLVNQLHNDLRPAGPEPDEDASDDLSPR